MRLTSSMSPLGNTALHDCAESGSLEIMRMLLQYGASMERDGYGMTPLLSASVTGHTNIVDYLTMHQQVRDSFQPRQQLQGLTSKFCCSEIVLTHAICLYIDNVYSALVCFIASLFSQSVMHL